mgnify:CR=1 FL=1
MLGAEGGYLEYPFPYGVNEIVVGVEKYFNICFKKKENAVFDQYLSLRFARELFFDLLVGGFRRLLEHDELLRYDAHLLEGDSLDLSPWEALDDPALLFLLHQVDLRPDELDYDLVLNVGVVSA